MKTKKFTHGITFFTDASMYQLLKDLSDSKKIGLSELLREIIATYLEKQAFREREK